MILDSFYLLFKTDASGASGDIKKLDDQISSLAAKGKKRSEQEDKELKELRKQRALTLQDLKDQQTQLDKIGQSFGDLAINALGALAAFASFNGAKNGILDAQKFNAHIATQSKVLEQNADDLRAYAAVYASFGGNADAFIKKQEDAAHSVIKNGIIYKNVAGYYNELRNQIKGLTHDQQLLFFSKLDNTDIIEQAMLMDDAYEKNIKTHRELAVATHDDYEEAVKFMHASEDAGTAFTTAYTRLGTDILPKISYGLNLLNEHFKDLEKEQGGIENFFIKVAAAATLLVAPLRVIGASLLVASEVGQAVTDVATGSRKSVLAGLSQSAADEIDKYWYGPKIGSPEYENAQKNAATVPVPVMPVSIVDKNGKEADAGSLASILYPDDPGYLDNKPFTPQESLAQNSDVVNQISTGNAGSNQTSISPALNVKIDSIKIDTQASDGDSIAQEFSTTLKGHLDDMWADFNDGIDR